MGKGSKGGVRIKQMGGKAPKAMMNPMDALSIPADEMVNMPQRPDRSYQIFWPMHETFNMQPEKFIVIYPSYLDSTKTVKQGRRIPKELAVDTPTVSDISMALQKIAIRHVLQPYKGYSRDITTLWDNPGRIKVDYDNNEKRMLLKELAETIPTLPERIQRLEAAAKEAEIAEQKRKEEEAKDQQQRQLQKHQQAATKTNNKKKGNKKKK